MLVTEIYLILRKFYQLRIVSASDFHIDNAPLFLKPWFLRALIGDELVVSTYQNGNVRAFWPMQRRKIYGLIVLQSPDLVPYTGPWFQYPDDMGDAKRSSEFRKGVKALMKQFPKYHALFGRINPSIVDFLPFHWEGSSVRPRITYRIPADWSIEKVEANMKSSNLRNIKKAKELCICEERDTNALWQLSRRTFHRQGLEPHFSADQLKRVYHACAEKGISRILSARDHEGNPHSAVLFVRDERFVYYYFGGSDPDYRNSEALSLLIWEGIKWSRELGLGFDFEGSMHEPVARFFRSWGAQQYTYFEVEEIRSVWVQFLFFLKTAFGRR